MSTRRTPASRSNSASGTTEHAWHVALVLQKVSQACRAAPASAALADLAGKDLMMPAWLAEQYWPLGPRVIALEPALCDSSIETPTSVTADLEAPTLVPDLAQVPEPPELKSASAEPSAFLSSTQPAGCFGSVSVRLVILEALKPRFAIASKHFCASLNAWPLAQVPDSIAIILSSRSLVLCPYPSPSG